jgi:hypothetical protein
VTTWPSGYKAKWLRRGVLRTLLPIMSAKLPKMPSTAGAIVGSELGLGGQVCIKDDKNRLDRTIQKMLVEALCRLSSSLLTSRMSLMRSWVCCLLSDNLERAGGRSCDCSRGLRLGEAREAAAAAVELAEGETASSAITLSHQHVV